MARDLFKQWCNAGCQPRLNHSYFGVRDGVIGRKGEGGVKYTPNESLAPLYYNFSLTFIFIFLVKEFRDRVYLQILLQSGTLLRERRKEPLLLL